MSAPDWLEYRIRASSIKDALDCAMRFEAKQLRGIRMPSSAPAHVGTAVHAGTALYDQRRMDHEPVTVDEAADAAIKVIDTDPEEGVVWDELDKRDARKAAVGILVNYAQKIAPERIFVAVEAKLEDFRITFEDVRVTIRLSGTTDRVRKVVGRGLAGYGISDVKSGAARVDRENNAISKAEKAQLAVYELLAEQATGLAMTSPAEVIGANTTGSFRVGFKEVTGTRDALIGAPGIPGTLEFLSKMLRSGVFPPNPSSLMCHERYCPLYPKCPYHD